MKRIRRALALPALLLCTLVLVCRTLGDIHSSTELADGNTSLVADGRPTETSVVNSSFFVSLEADMQLDDDGNRTTTHQDDDRTSTISTGNLSNSTYSLPGGETNSSIPSSRQHISHNGNVTSAESRSTYASSLRHGVTHNSSPLLRYADETESTEDPPSLRGSYDSPPSTSSVRNTIVPSLTLHQQTSTGLRSNQKQFDFNPHPSVAPPPTTAPTTAMMHHVGGPVNVHSGTEFLNEIATSTFDTAPPPTPPLTHSIAQIPVLGPVRIVQTGTETAEKSGFTGPDFTGPENRILSDDCGGCYPLIHMDGDNVVMFMKNEHIQFLSYHPKNPQHLKQQLYKKQGKFELTTNLKVDYDASSVSISGNTAVVGNSEEGKVYIFEKDLTSGTWEQTTTLSLEEDAGHLFGSGVSIDGNVLVVGATGDALDESSAGSAAYVYRRDDSSGSKWIQEAKLAVNKRKASYEVFGHVVSLKGNIIVTSDEYHDTNKLYRAVHVYEYDSSIGSWLMVGDSITNDECDQEVFGTSVEIAEGGNLLISCHHDLHGDTGAVFYYTRTGSDYVMQQKIVASDGSMGDEFGGVFNTIAVDGNMMSIGDGKKNRFYTFTLQDNLWIETNQLNPPAGFHMLQFGSNLALSGNRIIARSSSNAYFYTLHE